MALLVMFRGAFPKKYKCITISVLQRNINVGINVNILLINVFLRNKGSRISRRELFFFE